jgi:hypothetical protein
VVPVEDVLRPLGDAEVHLLAAVGGPEHHQAAVLEHVQRRRRVVVALEGARDDRPPQLVGVVVVGGHRHVARRRDVARVGAPVLAVVVDRARILEPAPGGVGGDRSLDGTGRRDECHPRHHQGGEQPASHVWANRSRRLK